MCVCRYVLISRPSEWSDQLRSKFLEGLDAFLELLKCMQVTHLSELTLTWTGRPRVCPAQLVCLSQGMDPVVRQVGQHIEMEPEWEAAFTLQMKLTHIISMIQDWCSTDVSLCTSTAKQHTHASRRSILITHIFVFVCKPGACAD